MDRKWNILVIDDEAGIRQGCCRVLQPQGFTVETASSFQEGLGKIRTTLFDLVLLDLMLPDGKCMIIFNNKINLYQIYRKLKKKE